MNYYLELLLLGILFVVIYHPVKSFSELLNNKLILLFAILLNGYIAKTYGITSGIIIAIIIIVLLENKDEEIKQEGFTPKLSVLKPATFTGPCITEIDRNIKLSSEKANMNCTK